MKVLKRTAAIITGLLTFVWAVGILLIERVDRRPYQDLDIYKETIEAIRIGPEQPTNHNFSAGWASVNITPSYPIEIAGYGLRNKSAGTIDSVFVYTMVLDNGVNRVALVSADLLIFPPAVVKAILKDLPEGFSQDNIFFTASHSHNSPGGWMNGLAAEVIAGETDAGYISAIAKATKTSILKASQDLHAVELDHGKFQLPDFVKNRIRHDGKKHSTAYLLRAQSNQDTALIFSYAAHANTFSRTTDSISRDYPGYIMDQIQSQKLANFALFCAGPVGSMGNDCGGRPDKECREVIGAKYTEKLKNTSFSSLTDRDIRSGRVNILLKDPAYRLTTDLRVRPWLFSLLMGEQDAYISYAKIGNLIFLGMPCDFSGELAADLEKEAENLGLNLVITSFNGSYIGYITPDEYCDFQHHETIDMNWCGTGTGSYFKDISREILRQLASDDDE